MPSALVMLMCYEVQLERARVEGLAAIRERARLGLVVAALTELVDGDFKRRWDDPREGLLPAA